MDASSSDSGALPTCDESHGLVNNEENIKREEGKKDEQEERKEEEEDDSWRGPLHRAALTGDWEAAKVILDRHKDAITGLVSRRTHQTALHVAVRAYGKRALHFVEELVKMMTNEAVKTGNEYGSTALHFAAVVGNTEAASILLNKNLDLLYIRDEFNRLPVLVAVGYGPRDIFMYLLKVTNDNLQSNRNPFSHEIDVCILLDAISAQYLDVALDLVERYPHLATGIYQGNAALHAIAAKSTSFPSGTKFSFWDRLVYHGVPLKLECNPMRNEGDIEDPVGTQIGYLCSAAMPRKLCIKAWKLIQRLVPRIEQIKEKKLMHHQAVQLVKLLCTTIASSLKSNRAEYYGHYTSVAMTNAATFGVPEVIEEILETFPGSFETCETMFLSAVAERCENVFNLAYQMPNYRRILMDFFFPDGSGILHLVAKLAPPHKLNLVSGAALQMQRELQWFKEVKKFSNHITQNAKNKEGQTPQIVFSEAHKELVKEGERWMRETANSCIIAASLIVTIVFAAAFTVPGGNNQDNGLPILSKNRAFLIFAVSDAISLFSSTTSLLMFLAILTSRYAENDFLNALPRKLIIGLVTLFLAITFMMIAFGSTLYVLSGQGKPWILICVAMLASLPVTSFVFLQFPLLDVISSTYGPGIFGKKGDRILI